MALVLSLSGCARIAIHFETAETRQTRLSPIPTRAARDEEKPKVVPGRVLPSRRYTVAFLGAKSFSGPIDLTSECPEGWGDLTTRVTGLQALFRVITLNLYSPWTVDMSCRPTVEKPVGY